MTDLETNTMADAALMLLGPAEVGRAAGQSIGAGASDRIVRSARLRRTVLGLSKDEVEVVHLDVLRHLAKEDGPEKLCLRAEALLRRSELRRTIAAPLARALRDRFGEAVVEWAVSWDGELADGYGEGAGLDALHAWMQDAGPACGGLAEITIPEGMFDRAASEAPSAAIAAAVVQSDAT